MSLNVFLAVFMFTLDDDWCYIVCNSKLTWNWGVGVGFLSHPIWLMLLSEAKLNTMLLAMVLFTFLFTVLGAT